jgi:hypothetical protein
MREWIASMHNVRSVFLQHISLLSVCFALAGFVFSVGADLWKGDAETLQKHLGRALAAAAIPAAFALICLAFDPASVAVVPGLEVPIAFGGMALLYVSFKEAVK